MNRFTSPEIEAAVAALFARKSKVRALVIPDWHIPQHDRKATDLVIRYADHERVNGVPFDFFIQIGDFMNHKVLSKHENWNKVSFEGLRLKDDYVVAGQLLNDLADAIPGSTPSFVIEGNHDHRLVKYLAEHPELIGNGLTVPELLDFETRKIVWVPNWSEGKVLRIGNATFVHGSIVRKHHAAGMMDKFQTNVFYGHTHDEQLFSAVSTGEDKVRVAHSLGCLEDRADYWEQFNGNRWQTAFADFTFFKDGGFSYSVHKIVDNRTVINGRVFGPKGLVR